MSNIGKNLNLAAEILERNEWLKRSLFKANIDNPTGSYLSESDISGCCMAGAINVAIFDNLNYENGLVTNEELECETLETYGFILKYLNSSIWAWNDEKDRTKEEVLNVLRKAAKESEEMEREEND